MSINLAYFEALSRLPDMAKSVLQHDETADFNVQIADQYKLTLEQGRELAHLIQFMIMQLLKPADLAPRIAQALSLDAKTSKALACDLLGWRFLPLEWFVGDVQTTIRSLGGDPEKYLVKLRTLYPEVYSNGPLLLDPTPDPDDIVAQAESAAPTVAAVHPIATGTHQALLDNFDDRLTSFKGRAEILLRLTGLSSQIEEGMKNKTIPETDGQQLMQQLDAISYAVNTQDLNLFEVQSIKRRLTKVLDRISELGQ